jgi:hypothetical protein
MTLRAAQRIKYARCATDTMVSTLFVFYSILFYSILFCSILFYSILFHVTDGHIGMLSSETTHKGKVSCIICTIRHMMWEGISMNNISYHRSFPPIYFVVYYVIITILQFPKLVARHYCSCPLRCTCTNLGVQYVLWSFPASLTLMMTWGGIETCMVHII